METFLGISKHYDTRTCAVASNVTTLPTLVRHHVRLESLVSSLKGLYQGRVPKTKYSALDHKKYVLPSRPQLLRGGEGKLQHPQIPGLKEAFKVNPLGCIQIRFTRLHLNTTGTADMMACQPDSSPKTFQFLNVSKCSHNTRALFLFIINTYCLCIQF